MNDEMSQIVAECLEAIEQNQLTVEECLEKYPEHRRELIDLLQVAMQVRLSPRAYPTAAFQQGAGSRLAAKLPRRGVAGSANGVGLGAIIAQWWRNLGLSQGQSWALGTAALLICALLVGVAVSNRDDPAAETIALVPTSTTSPTSVPTVEATAVASATPLPEVLPSPTPTPVDTFAHYLPLVNSPLIRTAQTAVLTVAQGVVEIQDSDGNWTAAPSQTTVAAGQRIRTNAFSRATLTFYDDSQAKLGPNSEISLDQVEALLPEEGFRTIVMTQWLGESEHDVDFRNDSGSRYEVLTPNGSGRARGTTFRVVVTAGLLSQFMVDTGRVDVTHLNTTVIIVAGQISVVAPEQPPSPPRFTVVGEGEVTAVGESWEIGGQTFTTNEATILIGNPQIGDIVTVWGYLLPDGTLVATHIILRHPAPTPSITFVGTVESMEDEAWVVAGQTLLIDDDTYLDDLIALGDVVRVYATIQADGSLLATRIHLLDERHPFEFFGVVQSIGDETWLVSGISIALDEGTEIKDAIAVGDVVKVEGVILANNRWLAQEIKLDDSRAKFEFTGSVQALEPWMVAGIALETDVFTEIDANIALGDVVYVEGQVLDDGRWLATEIRLLSDTSNGFTFIGLVNGMEPWLVSGILLATEDGTMIDAGIEVGMLVRVHGRILPDGRWLATHIARLMDDDTPQGCYTLTTMIVSMSGNQITLEGLAPIVLGEGIVVEGNLVPNTIISITICVGQDGTIQIVSIVVIHYVPPPPPPPPTPSPGGGGGSGGNPPPPSGGGGSYTITDNNQSVNLSCNGHSVTVNGNDNTVTLTGSCGSIVVRGNNNTVFYQSATSVTNTGNNNNIQQR